MKTVKIRESLKSGWSLFMKRPWYLLGLWLAVVALFMVVSSNAMMAALAAIIYAGYIALMLRFTKGESIKFDELFTIDQRWVYFAFLIIIKTFFIMLGFLCFIIPGIYLSVRWMFAEVLVVDKGLRPLEALKASSALTEGVRGKLFLFVCVGVILMIVGLIFLLVGAIVAAIVTTFAMLQIYLSLQTKVAEIPSPATV